MNEPSQEAAGDERLVPISALQHMLYCPRQCALIHIEQQWTENRFTAEGRILHQRVDAGGQGRRGDIVTARAVPLRSKHLGVVGVADVVEMRDGTPYPVEYKRGREKRHRADEVQLCAQGICLEEMLKTPVREGALFYGKARRRKAVVFDDDLRRLTLEVATETAKLLESGMTPRPIYEPRKCDTCSLKDNCQPQRTHQPGEVSRWLARAIKD